MKKLLILSAGAMLISGFAFSQNEMALKRDEKNLQREEKHIRHEKKETRQELKKLQGDDVSYMARQQFYSDFGNIPGTTWRRTETYDVASFAENSVSKSAYYDGNAKLVGTVESKTFRDLPGKTQKYIKKKWSGYDILHVIYFNDNE